MTCPECKNRSANQKDQSLKPLGADGGIAGGFVRYILYNQVKLGDLHIFLYYYMFIAIPSRMLQRK